MNNTKTLAIIRNVDSEFTRIEVEFPHSIGHYRSIEYALKDIELFKCIPILG